MLAALLLGFATLAQDGTPPYNPCPPFSASTEFCFENSVEYATPCERTVCINYSPKPDKIAALANCTQPPSGAFCITLQPGETGCVQVPHPAGDFSDWFNIEISVRSSASGATVYFNDNSLQNAIENEVPYYSPGEIGGCESWHTVKLNTTDGRNFVIKETYLLKM